MIQRVSVPLLFALAIAYPWDLYQRLPFEGLTLVKLCGLVLTGAALVLFAIQPTMRRFRTGFEAPIALFVVAAVQSASHSMDSAASAKHLILLGTYIALFIATAAFVRTTQSAIWLLRTYAVSTLLVALMGMACFGGVLWPTAWRPTYGPWETRLIDVWRDGVMMRVAAASPDVNQGALLMAMGFAIFLFSRSPRSIYAHMAVGHWPVFLGLGILWTQSRSALGALAVLISVRLFGALRRRLGRGDTMFLLFGLLTVLLAIVIYTSSSFLSRDDHSLQGRTTAYRAAAELLPKHAWLGVGLGATDAALDRGPSAQEIDGATLHNVPFKVLLETGVLGFIALIWFFVQFARTLYQRRTESPDMGELAACASAAMFVAFAMSLVQPLQWMSVYPFLAGVAVGPFARRVPEEQPISGMSEFRPTIAVVATLVALMVIWNVRVYQQRVNEGIVFSDALAEAAQLERDGHLPRAFEAYARALPLADTFVTGRNLNAFAAYTDTVERLVDFEKTYDAMGIGMERPDTRAVVNFAMGRIQFELGNTAASRVLLREAIDIERWFAECYITLGDCEWARGDFISALAAYGLPMDTLPGHEYWRRRWRIAPWDTRIDELVTRPDDAASQLERMWLLRKRGRWIEAVAIAQLLANEPIAPADAWLYLAIEAERQGRPAEAVDLYRRALAADPYHLDTLRRIVFELRRAR